MIKKLIAAAVAVVVVLIVAVVGVFLYIDSVARSAVERAGTRALGVDTSLASMDIAIFSGACDLSELQIANPQPFQAPFFLRLADGRIAVRLGTLMEQHVVIPEITLTGVELHLEKRGDEANYDVITANLRDFAGGDAEPAPADPDAKTYVVDRLTISDITVHADLLGLGVADEVTTLEVQIDEIVLEDVGSDTEGGVVLAELQGTIIAAILEAVSRKAGGLPEDMVADLGASLEGLGDIGIGAMEVVGGLDKLGDDPGKAIEDIGRGVEGVIRGSEGLEGALRNFGKKDEDEENADADAE